jgi:hypothetical protein
MKILMLILGIQASFAQISLKEEKMTEIKVMKKKNEQKKRKAPEGSFNLIKKIQEQNAELLKRIGIPDERAAFKFSCLN